MSHEKNPSVKSTAPSRFAVIHNLTTSGRTSPSDTLKRLAELLGPSKLHGTIRIRLLDGGKVEDAPIHTVTVGGGKAKHGSKSAAKTTVELITTPETWAEIAAGRLAPHDAFLGGLMRVRGSVGLAQRMLKHVAGSDGATYICREEG
jgi:hypothetical protein